LTIKSHQKQCVLITQVTCQLVTSHSAITATPGKFHTKRDHTVPSLTGKGMTALDGINFIMMILLHEAGEATIMLLQWTLSSFLNHHLKLVTRH
jgi:hypothetical protein